MGGHDLNFAYLMHPYSNMPVFTDITDLELDKVNHQCDKSFQSEVSTTMRAWITEYQDSLPIQEGPMSLTKCWLEARQRLLQYRAGFRGNGDRAMQVQGKHADCCFPEREGYLGVCPDYPLSVFKELSFSDIDVSVWCRDQDVALMVLGEACEKDPFISGIFKTILGNENDLKCEMIKPYCSSMTRNSSSRAPWHFDLLPDLSEEWRRILLTTCPETCGGCNIDPPLSYSEANPLSSYRVPKLRRL